MSPAGSFLAPRCLHLPADGFHPAALRVQITTDTLDLTRLGFPLRLDRGEGWGEVSKPDSVGLQMSPACPLLVPDRSDPAAETLQIEGHSLFLIRHAPFPKRKELWESVHARATENHHAATRRETTEERARRILTEELDKLGWAEAELAGRAKGEARKIRIAQRLRAQTAVTLKWIAAELHMGTWTHVANRLHQTKVKSNPANQHELNLV